MILHQWSLILPLLFNSILPHKTLVIYLTLTPDVVVELAVVAVTLAEGVRGRGRGRGNPNHLPQEQWQKLTPEERRQFLDNQKRPSNTQSISNSTLGN